jgi:hypothetical protein
MDTLAELFTKQTGRIIERKFHVIAGLSESDFINRHLMSLKQLLIQYYEGAEFKENRIPFLIVVPHTIVPLSYQLKTIRESIGDTRWEYVIQPEWFKNAEGVATPEIPYLLLDVDTGYALRNTRPKKCVEIFTAEGRFALTIDEGLALITHFPEVLESHWIDLPGSVLIHKLAGQEAMKRGMLSALPAGFGLATFVPTLHYKYYNSLRLYYVEEMNETPYSGSASCGRRLAP